MRTVANLTYPVRVGASIRALVELKLNELDQHFAAERAAIQNSPDAKCYAGSYIEVNVADLDEDQRADLATLRLLIAQRQELARQIDAVHARLAPFAFDGVGDTIRRARTDAEINEARRRNDARNIAYNDERARRYAALREWALEAHRLHLTAVRMKVPAELVTKLEAI